MTYLLSIGKKTNNINLGLPVLDLTKANDQPKSRYMQKFNKITRPC